MSSLILGFNEALPTQHSYGKEMCKFLVGALGSTLLLFTGCAINENSPAVIPSERVPAGSVAPHAPRSLWPSLANDQGRFRNPDRCP
jgi:hypothetical protein